MKYYTKQFKEGRVKAIPPDIKKQVKDTMRDVEIVNEIEDRPIPSFTALGAVFDKIHNVYTTIKHYLKGSK